LNRVWSLYERIGRFDDAERMIERMRLIDPQSPMYLWNAWALASSRGDLVTALEMAEEAARIDIGEPEGPSVIAMNYFDLGDGAAAKYWTDAALQIDSEAPYPRIMAALLHLYHDEQTEAVSIARELARPDSHNRWGTRGIALRILAASDLATGNHEDIIARYLTHYPELADAMFPTARSNFSAWEAFLVALDLASAYLRAGEMMKAESLLSLIESELPHWSQTGAWLSGYGYADMELHALRGDKDRALASLREGAAKGIRNMWRFRLLHNPNLESIRDTPEFAAMIAEIEADMAAQLERVREMERNGELEPIPEIPATTH
jgi:tetratricopeptide (TPR) repeat protein